jgi:hypothetical protein
MANLTNLYGLSTTILDFTRDLSPLLVGLVCLVWFSAGMIVWSAVQHYWSEKIRFAPRAASTSADDRDAA